MGILENLAGYNSMQTNPAVEQSKIIRWFDSPCNQSGKKGKGL